jgi:hypothetical protein
VGAIAPVTSPSSSRASGCCVRLAPVWLGCQVVAAPVQRALRGSGVVSGGGQLPYSTAQHIPRRQASRGRAVYATSENRTSHAARPGRASAVIGDHTTVRVVTGEIPVRFEWCIPLNVRHEHFWPQVSGSLPPGYAGQRRGSWR